MTHPTDFLIAHRLFLNLRQGPRTVDVWGALTDGPEDMPQLLDRLADWAATHDGPPSLATLKVWRFQCDAAPREVTEDVLALLDQRLAEMEAAA